MYDRITGEDPYKRAHAHLSRRPLHDGRALGRLQPDEQPARACSCSARPTSPTTARTGSARRRSCRVSPTATSCCRTRSATTSRRCSAPSRCRSTIPRSRSRSTRSTSRRARCCRSRASKTVDEIHRELGHVLWDNCGMARTEQSLSKALAEIPAIRDEFWKNVLRARREREPQPGAREGRPGRRLPRVRRADGARRARSATRAAAATSARSTRPKTARRCATTSTSRTSPRGSSRASTPSPSCTRNRSNFEYVHPSTRSYK